MSLCTDKNNVAFYLTICTGLCAASSFFYPGVFGYVVGEGDVNGYNNGMLFFCIMCAICFITSLLIYFRDIKGARILNSTEQMRTD